jgi:CRP/FNR family transcriptional regulator, anaerobic regulatory protein
MDINTLRKNLPSISDMKLLEQILLHSEVKSFRAGDYLLEPGKYIKAVPIVLSGTIKIIRVDQDGKELFLYYLEPGDTCAVSLTCCSASKHSEVKAVAEEDTKVIMIPVNLHEQWTSEFRQWKEFVAQTYQHRFDELFKIIDDIAFKNMDQRLIQYLALKARQNEKQRIETTHQEIAKELGTSREVISRLLKKMENDGQVELGRNVINLKLKYEDLLSDR